MADTHMVGYEIEDQADIVFFEGGGQPRESLLAAELGVEPVMVDDVVAMCAARTRFEERRGVEMADAEVFEIGNERGGVVEAEGLGELQPIGGERHRVRHQRRPRISKPFGTFGALPLPIGERVGVRGIVTLDGP